MESLYTKYRPKTFEEVVGQEHVVETLKRAVLEAALARSASSSPQASIRTCLSSTPPPARASTTSARRS